MDVKLRKNPLRQLNLLEQEKQVFSTKTWGGGKWDLLSSL